MEQIEEAFEISSKIIGIKPITEHMIEEETKHVTKINQTEPNKITKFFRENLKMDDEVCDNIDILDIFPSRTEDSNIMYICCENTDNINKITSHVRNLGKVKGPNAPSIVNHIPKIMYKHYHHCEKMLWKSRQSNTGKYQTKIRSGIRDFILTYKVKGDDTPWSQVPSLTILDDAPGAKLHLLKENTKQTDIPNTTTAPSAPPGPPTSWNNVMDTQEAMENVANSTPMEEDIIDTSQMHL